MKHLFFGGVHPSDRKELSNKQAPLVLNAPKELVIPLSQHLGAPCKPLVKIGDKVKMGQMIGDGEGLCVPIHASVSGTVIDICNRPHSSGNEVMSIVIENDFQDTKDETLKPVENPSALSIEELNAIIRKAGIVGMGGATFPTNIKIQSAIGEVDTIIANVCECEPYITADDMLLSYYPERVLTALQLLHRLLKPNRTVLAIEDNKANAISSIQKQLSSYSEIELKVLPTRYPQGAEKQLIQAVTGREVPPGKLPKDVRCVVLNASTLSAIYQAVYEGKPVIERIVTITGEAVKERKNFLVRLGTPIQEVIQAGGGLSDDVWKVICGGPMMGTTQKTLSVPVIKGTNAVLCLSNAQNGETANPTCIRCGKCLSICPMRLQPLYLYRYTQEQNLKELDRLHLMDCIECGCCSYTCPGKLPLVERFRAGKKAIREAK